MDLGFAKAATQTNSFGLCTVESIGRVPINVCGVRKWSELRHDIAVVVLR